MNKSKKFRDKILSPREYKKMKSDDKNRKSSRKKKKTHSQNTLQSTIKVFLIFSMLILTISFVSSYVLPSKTYIPIEKTIKIYDWNFIGKIFDIKLAEYKLTKNSDFCLIDCYSEGVAVLYSDGKLFEDLTFKSKLGTFADVSEKIYLMNTITYNEEKDIWDKSCSTQLNKTTGKDVEICTWYVAKTIYTPKEYVTYTEYKGEQLKAGTYEWRIEGKKKINENVDWIGTAYGTELSEWAWWNSSVLYKQKIEITEPNVIDRNLTSDGLGWLVNVTLNFTAGRVENASEIFIVNSTETGELESSVHTLTTSGSSITSAEVYFRLNERIAKVGTITLYAYYDCDACGAHAYTQNYTDMQRIYETGTAGEYGNWGQGVDYMGGSAFAFLNTANTWKINKSTATYGWAYYLKSVVNTNPKVSLSSHFETAATGGPGTDFGTGVLLMSGTSTKLNWTLSVGQLCNGDLVDYGGGTALNCSYLYGYPTSSDMTTAFLSASPYKNISIGLLLGHINNGGYSSSIFDNIVIREQFDGTLSIGNEEKTADVPTATLVSPINYYNSSSQSVTFNCTGKIKETSLLDNVSLWLGGEINYTENDGTDNYTSLQKTLTVGDGKYNWTCSVVSNGTTSQTMFATNRTFEIDSTSPTVNITSIINTTYLTSFTTSTTINISLNFSSSDVHLQNCWYNNGTANVSLADCTTNDSIVLPWGSHTFIYYANDSFGNLGTYEVTAFWTYLLYLGGQSYLSPIIEGSSSTFGANFSTNGSAITLAVLNYNGTNYPSTINDLGGNSYSVSKSISSPLVTANSEIPFFWNITQGVYEYSIPTLNQTVLNIGVDDCSSGLNNVTIYNFTIYDEELQTILSPGINITGRIELSLYPFSSNTPALTFNKYYNENSSLLVCFNHNFSTGENFKIDVLVEYDALGYEKEFYNIQNQTINNTSLDQNISLYDLNTTVSQVFILRVKDSSFLNIEDALVEIHRKYIDEGLYRIVELPKTDNKGETLGHLVLNDVIYKFVIRKYGTTIATFSDVRAVCQTPAISDCVIDFNNFATGTTVPNYESEGDFNFTLDYNETSGVISSFFIIPSGSVETVNLTVINTDALGTSVCTDSTTSSSGTLSCVIPNSFGNATVVAKIYKAGTLQSWGSVKINQNPSDIFGKALIFIALFIMLTLIGAGMSDNPVLTLVFLLVGVILLTAMNIIANNGFIGATATILWLVVAIVIVIIKAGRRS